MTADDPMRMMCNYCEADIKQRYVWWSNQHGQKIRFFCPNCGAWEDRKHIYGKSFACLLVRGHAPRLIDPRDDGDYDKVGP